MFASDTKDDFPVIAKVALLSVNTNKKQKFSHGVLMSFQKCVLIGSTVFYMAKFYGLEERRGKKLTIT